MHQFHFKQTLFSRFHFLSLLIVSMICVFALLISSARYYDELEQLKEQAFIHFTDDSLLIDDPLERAVNVVVGLQRFGNVILNEGDVRTEVRKIPRSTFQRWRDKENRLFEGIRDQTVVVKWI